MSQYLPITNENPQQCPDCGEGEVLQLLEDLHACTVCRKTWSGAELEKTLDRPANRMEDAQILQCWTEQTRRKPGEHSSGDATGTRSKEDKLRVIKLGEPWDPTIASAKTQKIAPLTEVVRIPGLVASSEEIRKAIGDLIAGEMAKGAV